VHEVLRKYKNSKFSHLFIQILFFATDDSCAGVFCIAFHEQNFEKMKTSDGIEVFSFGIEKVWKMVFENMWEPCICNA